MDRNVLLSILGAMPDEMLLKALSANGLNVASAGQRDPMMEALTADDKDNRVKGFGELQLTRGPDDRPPISDKDYIIQKLAVESGLHDTGMPFDEAEGAYDAPGGF